jgi:hypothetical protein
MEYALPRIAVNVKELLKHVPQNQVSLLAQHRRHSGCMLPFSIDGKRR